MPEEKKEKEKPPKTKEGYEPHPLTKFNAFPNYTFQMVNENRSIYFEASNEDQLWILYSAFKKDVDWVRSARGPFDEVERVRKKKQGVV